MIKTVEISGHLLVLHAGSQEQIDIDIFRILEWYAEQYGIDAMYDMLLVNSRKLIWEAKETNECTKQ